MDLVMKCCECDAGLERDLQTGNYFCPNPECGKGGISSSNGITTTVDEDGNFVLSSKGRPS